MQAGAGSSLKGTSAQLSAKAQMGPAVVLWALETGPKRVSKGAVENLALSPLHKEPDDQVKLPHYFSFTLAAITAT